MEKTKRKHSLVNAIVLLMSVVLIVMLAVQGLFLVRYYTAMEEKSTASLDAIALQARISLDYELDGISTSGVSTFRNTGITDILNGKVSDKSGAVTALSEIMGPNSSIDSIFLVDKRWTPIGSCSKESADSSAAYELYLATEEQWREKENKMDPWYGGDIVSSDNGDTYFAYVQPVLYLENFELASGPDGNRPELVGYAIFVCSLNSVYGTSISSDTADHEVIVSYNGTPVACSSNSLAEKLMHSERETNAELLSSWDYIVKEYALDEAGWSVIALAHRDDLISDIIGITLHTGALLFIVTIAAISFALIYLTKNMARPIKRMERELMIVSDSDSSHRLTEAPDNEIGEVCSKVNLMLDRLDDANHASMKAQQEKYESEILRRKAEINYIHAQINPHFLYNSLETVCGMAAMHRDDLVIDTCTALSSLFRYSIRENDRVCLEEELKYATNYFYVMNQRYRGKLELKINVRDEDKGVFVPKMILQPVLENSLKHGGLNTLDQGLVSILAERDHDSGCFIIYVRDNGCGIAPKALDELNEQITADALSDDKGQLGLRNLNARLRLSCGGKSGIVLASEEGKFTEVQLIIDMD